MSRKVITFGPTDDQPCTSLLASLKRRMGIQITDYYVDGKSRCLVCPIDHLEFRVLEERNIQIGYYCGNGHWISESSVNPNDRRGNTQNRL